MTADVLDADADAFAIVFTDYEIAWYILRSGDEDHDLVLCTLPTTDIDESYPESATFDGFTPDPYTTAYGFGSWFTE